MSSLGPQQIPSRPKSTATMSKFDELSFELHKYGDHELQRVGVWIRSQDALIEAIEAAAHLNNKHSSTTDEADDVDKAIDSDQADVSDRDDDDDVDMSELLEGETATSSESNSPKGSSSKASSSEQSPPKNKPSTKLSKREKDRRRRRLKPVIDDTSPNQRPRWVIYIHGGAWRDPNITYESFVPTIKHLVSRTTPIPIAGFASIDYRLSAHPDFPQDADTPPEARREARHPDHLEDVCSALTFLICKYDIGHDYLLVGHSVGATLAFQLVTRVLNTQAAKWDEEKQNTIEHVRLSTAPQERIRKRKRSLGFEYGDQTGHSIHGDDGDFEERVHDKQTAIGLVGCDWQDEVEGDETMQDAEQAQSSKSQPEADETAGGSSEGQMQVDTALLSVETPTPDITSAKGKDSSKVVLFEDLYPDKRAKDFETDFCKIDDSADEDEHPSQEDVDDEKRLDEELTKGDTKHVKEDSDAFIDSFEEDGDNDDSADDDADDWEDVQSEKAARPVSITNQYFPLPFAIVGIAGIYDFEGYNARHGDSNTSFFAGAYGPHKAEWSLAAPARYGGQFAYWHARRVVVIGSSTEDEYIDGPETQSMLERLTVENIIYFANRCLRGSHNSLWQDGAQAAQLVVEALSRARVFPLGDWERIPNTKEPSRKNKKTSGGDGKGKGGGRKSGKKGNKVKKGLKEERAGVGEEVE